MKANYKAFIFVMDRDTNHIKFSEAIAAIDTGDFIALQHLLNDNPELINMQLDSPNEGYFKNPFLLWFVADNPIRHQKLPANIAAITKFIIQKIQQYSPETLQQQIDYTLGLVATGRIPRECGVQIELMDVLIDAGATPGNGHGALAHGNMEAAAHLIKSGGKLTLPTAICLDLNNDILQLLKTAIAEDIDTALVVAAFYGKVQMISFLIDQGANVNTYLKASSGFHSHATALHQAVYSSSLDAVKLLVQAGANLNATDRLYHGTPLGWAQYMPTHEQDENKKKQYASIAAYLQTKMKQ